MFFFFFRFSYFDFHLILIKWNCKVKKHNKNRNKISLDHPDYSVYDCCLPRNVWTLSIQKKFTQSEAYPDMDIIADWLIWIVVNIQWEFEIKLKFDWLSLSNKYLYCFVEGRRTQKHQELRLKAVLRAYFIADRPWHFFENIKTIGGSKNCIWGWGVPKFL